MKIYTKEKIAYLLREEKKRMEISIPTEEEKEEIKETLKKLFAENFLTYSAFILNSMLGEERKTKPILSISGGYEIGKTITGNLIGKLSTDNFIGLPASDFRKTKALGTVLTNRVVIIDDIDERGVKKTLKFLEEVNKPYFAYGLTSTDTFFICISLEEDIFADWKMKDAVIVTFLNRNEFAKQNIEKLYKDREWILKTRGFYFSFLPEVLKKMEDEEIQKMEIFKNCERYVKMAYALSKILGDEYNEFGIINSEFEFGY